MGNRNAARNNEQDSQADILAMKNYNTIRKESIKLVKIRDSIYYLYFRFSWAYPCVITIYPYWIEYRSKENKELPIYFHTPEYAPDWPARYKFSAGRNKKFPERAFTFDFSKFNGEELTKTIKVILIFLFTI